MTDYNKLKTRADIITELTKEFKSYDWINLASFNHPGMRALRNFGVKEKELPQVKIVLKKDGMPDKKTILRMLRKGYEINDFRRVFNFSRQKVIDMLIENNLHSKPNIKVTKNGKSKTYETIAECAKDTGAKYRKISGNLLSKEKFEYGGVIYERTDNYDRL